MARFTLQPGTWYACEFIGDEFSNTGYGISPIRVDRVVPDKSGSRTFRLEFFHANYPSGVNSKEYALQTIERGEHFILAKSLDHNPSRYLKIIQISSAWVELHFPGFLSRESELRKFLRASR